MTSLWHPAFPRRHQGLETRAAFHVDVCDRGLGAVPGVPRLGMAVTLGVGPWRLIALLEHLPWTSVSSVLGTPHIYCLQLWSLHNTLCCVCGPCCASQNNALLSL